MLVIGVREKKFAKMNTWSLHQSFRRANHQVTSREHHSFLDLVLQRSGHSLPQLSQSGSQQSSLGISLASSTVLDHLCSRRHRDCTMVTSRPQVQR